MILSTALHWHDQGIATIPVQYRGKRPDFGLLKRTGCIDETGKPVWEQFKDTLPTLPQLQAWFNTRLRNIAIVTGWQGLTVLDFDQLTLYRLWESWAADKAITPTYKVKTARGIHLYYFLSEPLAAGLKWPGIDVKAAGGYCLMPPSIHPSGTTYKALRAEILKVDSINDLLPPELLTYIPPATDTRELVEPPELTPFSDGLERIKARVRIVDLVPNARGGKRWYKAKCLFHEDKHASMWIDDLRNRAGCHACINGSLDVIDFYAKWKALDTRESIRELERW